MKILFLITIVFASTFNKCNRNTNEINKIETQEVQKWQKSFDFDNDGINDTITYSYTGGAHCCYQLKVLLSSFNKSVILPYYIDGGYMVFGLDNPDNFTIYDCDNDSIPEIILKVIDQYATEEVESPDEKIVIKFLKIGEIPVRNKYYSTKTLLNHE